MLETSLAATAAGHVLYGSEWRAHKHGLHSHNSVATRWLPDANAHRVYNLWIRLLIDLAHTSKLKNIPVAGEKRKFFTESGLIAVDGDGDKDARIFSLKFNQLN